MTSAWSTDLTQVSPVHMHLEHVLETKLHSSWWTYCDSNLKRKLLWKLDVKIREKRYVYYTWSLLRIFWDIFKHPQTYTSILYKSTQYLFCDINWYCSSWIILKGFGVPKFLFQITWRGPVKSVSAVFYIILFNLEGIIGSQGGVYSKTSLRKKWICN